jgi:glycosyltransferase involved in cell wall biosynthesis
VNSSVLVLIIPLHKSSKSIITGKLFEYLGSGRPVLCIGPDGGDAARIIELSGGGKTVDYDDPKAAASFIREIINKRYSVQNSGKIRFSRRNITAQLAEVIR